MSTGRSDPRWSERKVGERSIWVADGLLDEAFVEIVHRVLATLPYRRLDRDTAESETLHLVHRWTLEEAGSDPIVHGLLSVIDAAIAQRYGGYEPTLAEVYALDSSFGDILADHVDRSRGVSVIYYANKRWEPHWHGETIFYDDREPVAAVAPRPGRIAMFPADLRHRSGSPSRECRTSRRVIVFKYDTDSGVP